MSSSSEENGVYTLLLPNPVTGGSYSCRLSPLSPAIGCLHDVNSLMTSHDITVDEVKASLTLIEAEQKTVREDNARLKAELGRLKTETETAVGLGVFGAPSFVTRGEVFWGDDRLEDALSWARVGHVV